MYIQSLSKYDTTGAAPFTTSVSYEMCVYAETIHTPNISIQSPTAIVFFFAVDSMFAIAFIAGDTQARCLQTDIENIYRGRKSTIEDYISLTYFDKLDGYIPL